MQINKRERMMLLIGIPVVLIVLIWNFMTPAGSVNGKTKLVPLAKAKQDTDVARRTYNRMSADQKAIQPRIAQMAYDLPAEDLIPQTIRNLQDTADKAGVHLR